MSRKNNQTKNIPQGRGDRTAVTHRSDPYREQQKWSEPTACPACGLIFHKGRWQQGNVLPESEKHLCPACQRIHDRVPAARIALSGEYFESHRSDIMQTIYNFEKKQCLEHPLERIMDVVDESGTTIITFTDVHLAHGVGNALSRAHDGNLESQYSQEDGLTRLSWSR